jgi:Domain of unknown function (DUF1906)
MNLRALLKRDIAHRKSVIASSEHLINRWKHQLDALSTPLPRNGIDYAYGAPDLGRLRAAGVTFVCRYLGGSPAKDLGVHELARLQSAGMSIVTVFEAAAEEALAGAKAGEANATLAQELLDALGNPHAPVYFACDWEVQADQMGSVRGYFRGITHHLGRDRVGVYGGYPVVHELMSLDNVKYGWQTTAWSGGRWSPHAQLRQYQNGVKLAGIECDLDRAVAADFGQWGRG